MKAPSRQESILRDPWSKERVGLGSWIKQHLRAAASTLKIVVERFVPTILVWTSIGISLFLPASLWLLQDNLKQVTGPWENQPGLSVYFKLGGDSDSISQAMSLMNTRKDIELVKVISPEQALEEYQEITGLVGILDSLEENPLPASIHAVASKDANVLDLETLRGSLLGISGVDDVVIERTWPERIGYLAQLIMRASIMLGLLLGLATILVTAMSVSLAIEAQLAELRVFMLVGATRAQIYRPFYYFGFYYGVGGGLVASMLMSLSILLLESPIERLLYSYGINLKSIELDPILILLLLVVGSCLGAFGAMLASRRRLERLEII